MVTFTPTLLPDDLLVEILLRVPVRSLLRCKCVCKSWLSLISNALFAKSHFEAAAAPTDRFLMKFPNGSEAVSVDIEALCHNPTNVSFNIPIPPRAPKHGCWARIVGSCRGFLLLKYEFLHFVDFMVWNPSTGVQKYIYNMSTHSCLCGIGYDSSTDDYVIVNLTLERGIYDEFKVYHLRVIGECLCICLEGCYRETWTMKEYKVESSWTKSFFLSPNYYYRLPGSFAIRFIKIGRIWTLNEPQKLVRRNGREQLLEYDPIYRPHGMMYRESLLSLPGKFEEATKGEQPQQQE